MIKYFRKLKAKKGFTLVELIVVIAIIGVLAAILIPTMLGYVTSSRITSADSTAGTLRDTINSYIVQMDTQDKGIKRDSTAKAIGISVAGGVATVNVEKSLLTSGGSASNAFATGLAKKIASDYDFKDAFIGCYVTDGKVTGVFFYNGGSTLAPTGGTAITAPDAAAFTGGKFKWDNDEGGISGGEIIGTSPKITEKDAAYTGAWAAPTDPSTGTSGTTTDSGTANNENNNG